MTTPTTPPQPTLDKALRENLRRAEAEVRSYSSSRLILIAERDALAREVAELRAQVAEYDGYIVEAQTALADIGFEPGADGSVAVGIAHLGNTLAELREVADAFRKTAAAEHDELERVLRKNAELRADKERLEAQLMAVDAAREK